MTQNRPAEHEQNRGQECPRQIGDFPRHMRRCPVLGLTGGIASGKSTVARMFAELGAAVINADEIVGEVLRSPEIVEKLKTQWGHEFLTPEGMPDRAKIAEVVFQNPLKLKEWTGWVHPPTREKMRKAMELHLQDSAISLIIIDAPLLLEAQLDAWCDAVVFVDAEFPLRAERARSSRGWPESELKRREAAQVSVEQKRIAAQAVIRNDGNREETFQQVKQLFNHWIRRSPGQE